MLNFEIYKWACHGQLCLSTLTLNIWPGPSSTRSVMWCVWARQHRVQVKGFQTNLQDSTHSVKAYSRRSGLCWASMSFLHIHSSNCSNFLKLEFLSPLQDLPVYGPVPKFPLVLRFETEALWPDEAGWISSTNISLLWQQRADALALLLAGHPEQRRDLLRAGKLGRRHGIRCQGNGHLFRRGGERGPAGYHAHV